MEDDLGTRAALFGLLASESFNVTLSKTAEAALHELRSGCFDVVLTDERIPGSSGLWVATRVHEEGLGPNARVVLLTTDPKVQTNDWLTVLRKPLGTKRLMSELGSILGRPV